MSHTYRFEQDYDNDERDDIRAVKQYVRWVKRTVRKAKDEIEERVS